MGNPVTRRPRLSVGAIGAMCLACGAGAVAQHFILDRQNGRRRRHQLRDRARAALRRRSHHAVRRARYLEGVAEGAVYRAAHAIPGLGDHKEAPDDVTLARKVESIAFRKAHVRKDHVSVNVDNGVVHLRGSLERSEQIDELVRATCEVEGVRGVKNLLHTPAMG